MKRLSILIVLALSVPCMAQTAQPPAPGPEVQKLGYFLGTWKSEGESKASPFGPAGKFSGIETCEWFAGGFQLVCRAEGTMPGGKRTSLAILTYDGAAKAYTSYSISSQGESMSVKGSLAGKTWTWLWDGQVEGKAVKFRGTMVEVSPNAYTFKGEIATGGGPFAVTEEGKATKVK